MSNSYFRTYEEALSQCQGGYEAEDLVDFVFNKYTAFREEILTTNVIPHNSLPTVLGVTNHIGDYASKPKKITVLDLGGGGGGHYFTSRLAVDKSISLSWNVVETKRLAQKCRPLSNKELKFFYKIEDAVQSAGKVNIVLFSGSLQYLPNPEQNLNEVLKLQPKTLFLTRTGLTTNSTNEIYVQESKLSENGPGQLECTNWDRVCKYPITLYPIDKFKDTIRSNGYGYRYASVGEQPVNIGQIQYLLYTFYLEKYKAPY